MRFLWVFAIFIADSAAGHRLPRVARDVDEVMLQIDTEESCENLTELVADEPGLFEPCARTQRRSNDVHTKGNNNWKKEPEQRPECACEMFRHSWYQHDPLINRAVDDCQCGWTLSGGNCEERQCPWGEAFWSDEGRCIAVDDTTSSLTCQAGQKLYIDTRNGHAFCDCLEDHIFWPALNRCYPAYTRGPCPQAMQLVLSEESQTPTCVPNACIHDGLLGSHGWCYKLNDDSSLTLESEPPPSRNFLKGKLCADTCTPIIDPTSKVIRCTDGKTKPKSPPTSPPAFVCRKGSVADWYGNC